MTHYLQNEHFAATLTRLAPVWQAATGNNLLAEFLEVERPATFDPRTADWTRWADAVRPIAQAMMGEAVGIECAYSAERGAALGLIARVVQQAERVCDPGPAWIAAAIYDLEWAERRLRWAWNDNSPLKP